MASQQLRYRDISKSKNSIIFKVIRDKLPKSLNNLSENDIEDIINGLSNDTTINELLLEIKSEIRKSLTSSDKEKIKEYQFLISETKNEQDIDRWENDIRSLTELTPSEVEYFSVILSSVISNLENLLIFSKRRIDINCPLTFQ